MFYETRTEDMCICPPSPVMPQLTDGRNPPVVTKPMSRAQERNVAKVSLRLGNTLRAAAFFFVPAEFDEDQILAAATPVAEALGQHELEITDSVDDLICDLELVTESDAPGERAVDPIAAYIEDCIRSAIEKRRGENANLARANW